MAAETLHDAFINELANLLGVEKQLTEALPLLAQAANSNSVKRTFNVHLEETREHVERLQRIFEILETPSSAKRCVVMEELLQEGKDIIEEMKNAPAFEAMLIAAAQKVEHYEISAYGTLCAWAQILGYKDAKKLLIKTLQEEKDTDLRLSELGYAEINEGAVE
jgi:ferritin-like metal-binding protein YciE